MNPNRSWRRRALAAGTVAVVTAAAIAGGAPSAEAKKKGITEYTVIATGLDNPRGHAALHGPADPRDPFRGLGKVAALGIKVSRHRAYHGVALNVTMDLEPFARIDPCGYAGLQTVDLARLGITTTWHEAADRLAARLAYQFSP